MSTFIEILNPGEQLATSVTPDNKSTFALTEEDFAFINSVNMQLDMLKNMTVSIISHMEQQMETHAKILENLKDQFVMALAKKHGVINKEGTFSINLEHRIFLHTKDEE